MVREIKNFREAGSRGEVLAPGAVRPLRFQQVLDPLMQAETVSVTAGEQPENRPSRLRWRALGRRKDSVVVTGAALAPAAVGILNRAQPLTGAEHVHLAVVFTRGAQPAQREARSVNVRYTPAAIPASVRLLRAHQIIHCAPH